MTTAQEIMKLFTEKKTLQIFNTIAKLNGDDRIILLSALGLTNKRFYTRIHLLKYAGLVKKIDRYYHLTAFGKCIHKITCDAELQMTIAIKNYYNYVVIDSMIQCRKLTYLNRSNKKSRMIYSPKRKCFLHDITHRSQLRC